MTSRKEHPARAAAHRACRKISATVRETYDVEYLHGGWCGPDWMKATALDAELRSDPKFLALQAAAAASPF